MVIFFIIMGILFLIATHSAAYYSGKTSAFNEVQFESRKIFKRYLEDE